MQLRYLAKSRSMMKLALLTWNLQPSPLSQMELNTQQKAISHKKWLFTRTFDQLLIICIYLFLKACCIPDNNFKCINLGLSQRAVSHPSEAEPHSQTHSSSFLSITRN
jgi:hypothetical protein